jgi:hypothetical protein
MMAAASDLRETEDSAAIGDVLNPCVLQRDGGAIALSVISGA